MRGARSEECRKRIEQEIVDAREVLAAEDVTSKAEDTVESETTKVQPARVETAKDLVSKITVVDSLFVCVTKHRFDKRCNDSVSKMPRTPQSERKIPPTRGGRVRPTVDGEARRRWRVVFLEGGIVERRASGLQRWRQATEPRRGLSSDSCESSSLASPSTVKLTSPTNKRHGVSL